MFTGIIEAVSEIKNELSQEEVANLTLNRPEGWSLKIGQSIAVNGACLTVISFDNNHFEVELMPETIKRTSFRDMRLNSVNLERAMLSNGRLEGHIVQGHIDQVGTIVKIEESPKWRTLQISYTGDKEHLLVEKGSVTLNGISLTIVDVAPEWFSVSIIPHTLDNTVIGKMKQGDLINIEFDILGKFVAKNIQIRKG